MRGDAKLRDRLLKSVSRHGLEAFLESTRALVVLVDSKGVPIAANPAFRRLYGDESYVRSILEMVPSGQRGAVKYALESGASGQKPNPMRIRFSSAKGSATFDCLILPADRGKALVFAEPTHVEAELAAANENLVAELNEARSALAEKTAELQAVVAQVDELAHVDSLTFMQNRRSIISDLQREVTYSERYGTPLAVSMLDIDGFKSVNDRSGHQAGDRILVAVARELRDRIRQPDEIGRYGGDEFLVILPNTTAPAAGEQASRLCQHVRTTLIPFEGKPVHLTLSAGIAQFKPGTDNWQSLLERADRALYVAKRQGGDQWLILDS